MKMYARKFISGKEIDMDEDVFKEHMKVFETRLKNAEEDFKRGRTSYSDYLVQKQTIECERDELKQSGKRRELINDIQDRNLDVVKRDTVISEDDILNLIIDIETKSFDEIVA